MTFKAAVNQTVQIKGKLKAGLQALKKRDRRKIQTRSATTITGSVNLDKALCQVYPDDPRWDYGIGSQQSQQGNRRTEMVFWVEVHPATAGGIEKVARKLRWLKDWLSQQAPALNAMNRKFVWVASGNVSVSPRSTELKRLAARGLHFAGRQYELRSSQ